MKSTGSVKRNGSCEVVGALLSYLAKYLSCVSLVRFVNLYISYLSMNTILFETNYRKEIRHSLTLLRLGSDSTKTAP